MKRFGIAATLGFGLLLNTGCGTSSETEIPIAMKDAGHDHDHDHDGHDHHHADTYAEAVAEITEFRNTIRDSFAKNDSDAAHDPLHEVGHVLELVVDLAEKQGISGDQLTAVKTAVDTLFTAFGNVDKTMHGGEGSTYSEESDTIDAALKVLADAVPGAGTEPAAGSPENTDATPAAETPAADSAPAEAPKTEESGT